MRLTAACLLGWVLAIMPARADEPKTPAAVEYWDAAYLKGGRAGYVHTTIAEITKKGKKSLVATVDLNLTLKRFNDTIQIRAETGDEETLDGKVTRVFMKQFLAQKQQVFVQGVVDGDQLKLVLDESKLLKPAPWDSSVVGLARQQRLFQEKDVKPGSKFSYMSYEPTVSLVIKTDVEAMEFEDVELPGKKKQRLLRVEARPEKIEKTSLPILTVWLDESLQTVKQQVEIPGLGELTLIRTTKTIALGAGPVIANTDIGLSQLLRLNRRIMQPYEVGAATFRITIKGEKEPASTFAQDWRQKVVAVKDSTIDLQIKSRRGPSKTEGTEEIGPEFLQSNYFINCDDAKVKELARKAVGAEKDPWQKALKIEKWVHTHMRSINYEALATSDHVARTLEGDCTEYAMLFAAMCRAEGVPSRTAIGLIYADVKQGPVLAFHMWTEVAINKQWVPLDATLGRGFVGATHLKITEHSWHDTRTMTPLLPLIRVLGKMSIEVVEVAQ